MITPFLWAQPVFYPCMQHFMFLEQRITWHGHYPELLAAIRAGQPICFLVSCSLLAHPFGRRGWPTS